MVNLNRHRVVSLTEYYKEGNHFHQPLGNEGNAP